MPTVFDFGLNGKPPTHPELLDWLAAELIEGGWRMKRLHRLLVTSAIYRTASSAGEAAANMEKDPDNVYLWRMNSRRMEAEVVRDSVLATSGSLDPLPGGPPIPLKPNADGSVEIDVAKLSRRFRLAGHRVRPQRMEL